MYCNYCGKQFVNRSYLLLHKSNGKCVNKKVILSEVKECNEIEVMEVSVDPELKNDESKSYNNEKVSQIF